MLAIAICCFVLIPRQKKLRSIESDIRTTAVLQRQYLDKLEAIRGLPADPRVATLPMTKEEQSNFLRGLSHVCTQAGNRIVSVTALAAAPPMPAPPPGTAAPAVGAAMLPADVTEIKSTITFEGTFLSLRDFLAGLQRSRRLISLADCRIGAAQAGFPIVQTSLSIVRYVDNPAAASAGAGTGAAVPGGPQPAGAPPPANAPQMTAGLFDGGNRG